MSGSAADMMHAAPATPAAVVRRIAGAGGVSIAADLYGDPSGQPVVLLHGGGQSRSAWRGGAERLAAHGYRACAMDLRGHGDSDWSSDGEYYFDRHIGDLTAVIAEMGAPCVLVGASLGGHISLLTASRYPAQVRALALADVTPWINEVAAADMRVVMKATASGFANLDEAAAMIDRLRGTAPRGSSEGLRPHLRERADGRLYWRWDSRLVEDRFVRHEGEGGMFALAAERLTVPTLVMRGALSDVTSPAQVERFRRAVPNLVSVEIEGVGHMLTGENNDAYASAVVHFLLSGIAPPV